MPNTKRKREEILANRGTPGVDSGTGPQKAPVEIGPGSEEWVVKGAAKDETLLASPSISREEDHAGGRQRRNVERHGIDGNILEVIGNVRQILRATLTAATSAWNTTKRLDIIHDSGAEEYYFVRIYEGEEGEMAARGSCEASRAVGAREATLIPRCVGWGRMSGESPGASPSAARGSPPRSDAGGTGTGRRSFVVSKFYEVTPGVPDPAAFAAKLARLHGSGEGEGGPAAEKGGRFGFGTVTFVGRVRQEVGWRDDWEVFFSRKLASAVDRCAVEGVPGWDDVVALMPTVLEKVVPRLLRPLEAHGRSIKPAFLVGNLRTVWLVDEDEEDAVVIEPASFWGHNEYDLGSWTKEDKDIVDTRSSLLDQCHASAYHKRIPKAPPTEDYEDRIALYSALHDIYMAGNFPERQRNIQRACATFKQLVSRYPEGYGGQ